MPIEYLKGEMVDSLQITQLEDSMPDILGPVTQGVLVRILAL